MIDHLFVSNFRGLRAAHVEKLGALDVLLGPNGAGKSTVLEALLVGVSAFPAHALGACVARRRGASDQGEYLLHVGTKSAEIRVVGATERVTTIREVDSGDWREHRRQFTQHVKGPIVPFEVIGHGKLFVAADNHYHVAAGPPVANATPCRLIDPSNDLSQPAVDLYSNVLKHGRDEALTEALQKVLGTDVKGVAILTADGNPFLAVKYADRSVPIGLAGDGIHSLLRLVLELTTLPDGGLALLEEPEQHAHGRTLTQSALAIWSAVERDVQVVMTTHSLELLDALVATATPDRLDRLVVHRTYLAEGVLAAHRVAGPRVAERREDFAEDLR